MSLIIWLPLCFESCSYEFSFTCKFKFDTKSQTVGGQEGIGVMTEILEKVVGINCMTLTFLFLNVLSSLCDKTIHQNHEMIEGQNKLFFLISILEIF